MTQTIEIKVLSELDIELDNIAKGLCPLMIEGDTKGSCVCYRWGGDCLHPHNRELCNDYQRFLYRGREAGK